MRYRSALLTALATLTIACGEFRGVDPDFGVSQELATNRAAAITDLRYDVRFRVPRARTDTVTGHVSIALVLSALDQPLVLDFRGDSASIHDVEVNGKPVSPRITPGHVVIAAKHLRRGDNVVSMSFASSNDALNRNDDFMYALFVPDRAATAFPSFDQPDLKARFHLTLDVPAGWRAIANGPQTAADSSGDRVVFDFGDTEPISTYLFAFATGVLEVETGERDGRTYTMYHRETDKDKVARNREAIFDLHATAVRYLEAYTEVAYPFGKFAFFAVPSFQFGGMEHPGAVWYRASSLFLDESATQNQYLGRASLIAHETAHMWFGDYVTMRWFNDVWMKEVFANFMAAKIVQPSFPDVNHDLRFLLAHHQTAYGVDRTLGANAIRQNLENLRQAGSLYGAIIYQKAPIVMKQLERLVGDSIFQAGMRTYLQRYAFGNATWPDLIEILDALSPANLASWSRTWVETAWRPEITATWRDSSVTVTQRDPVSSRNLRWQQTIGVSVGRNDRVEFDTIPLSGDVARGRAGSSQKPDWILPGSDGLSYGRFVLDAASQNMLLDAWPAIAEPVVRATAVNALWEGVVAGKLDPAVFVNAVLRALPMESEELILQQSLGLLRGAYWRFLSDSAQQALAPHLEAVLWTALERADGVSRKSALWGTIVNITRSDDGVSRLYRVWARRELLRGLPLSEQQYTTLAEEIAIRSVSNADSVLTVEETRITNPDRKARFAFVRPSLSPHVSVRDSVFTSFSNVENRRRESWVLDALRYLNHPLRAVTAEHHVLPGLALAEEIQRTGDIFFPLSWLNALLDGHRSVSTAETIVEFLDTNPTLPPRLRGKVLQAADDVFRSARVVHGWKGGPALEGEPGR